MAVQTSLGDVKVGFILVMTKNTPVINFTKQNNNKMDKYKEYH